MMCKDTFIHGDFCLPNIFADDSGLTGLIDLGRAGVADKWQDIAICYRSLSNNYSGKYNGIKYSGYQNEMSLLLSLSFLS